MSALSETDENENVITFSLLLPSSLQTNWLDWFWYLVIMWLLLVTSFLIYVVQYETQLF